MTAPTQPLHAVTADVNRTESWQWHRVLAVVQQCTARRFVAGVFEHRRGAHRVLTTDAFLAAYLTHSFLVKDNLHQTQITNTIRGWTPSQRIAVGLAPDAVITYKMVTDGLARLGRACESATYPDWDAARFAQSLLDASLQGHSPTGAVALDSTDIETWGRIRYRKPLVDADPDTPARPDHSDLPHIPDAPKGHDGRYIYTRDPDARMGWRSASQGEQNHFCGYDAHVITDVPASPKSAERPVPHVARTLCLAPAGRHKGVCGITALDALPPLPPPQELIADRAYNFTRPTTFTIPAWQRGFTTIYDLHPNQRGRRPGPVAGTQWIDGTLYTTCLPEGLVDLAPLTRDMTTEQRAEIERLHQLRGAYAFTPHGSRDPDGRRRYRGPAVTHPSIRSPKAPRSMREDFRKPTVYCTGDTACGCAITVTLYDTDEPNLRMPMQHGTREWEDSYYRREGIESLFGDLKGNRLDLHRGAIRGYGLTRYTLLLGFALATMNMAILRDWHAKRHRLDPWGKVLGEPSPPVRRDRHPATGRRPSRSTRRTTQRPDR
ncbi:hypothetical protein [Antrihabitans stalactiti]|uniref:Transposase DDE domain-containing protein n=1 Tax=Antrihabitans stalactiti TaxID=2584121 RepID=A0A848KU35_9NOCA|nr:hypothetical protein [Antrihabitans stalactiti]NMN99047.1 hypothetical protein [Antrihabitans stalactiti]